MTSACVAIVFSSMRYAMHGSELITISYARPCMPRL